MRARSSHRSKDGQVGAVLVVGGGIGGIQASLDLAELGYYVYLVESSPAIGGAMAQLDKTFPTNDCSMCILSPKLVECGRHLNIETLTYSEVLDLEGEPGHFRATIKRKPRYVDAMKCTGCGECPDVCSVRITSEFDEGLVDRKAIYRPYAQAFPNIFTIDKRERSPCVMSCPARVNVQGYVALISQGKYEEAVKLIYENLPLPGVLGRICPHPCETECNRASLDEPIAICDLKRFVVDRVQIEPPRKAEERPERVAIIGSGPAGLSAAYYLSLEGYPVTIFEKLSTPGGMLRTGIPEYRLPRELLNAEIDYIRGFGVDIKTNVSVGEDIALEDLFSEGFKAIFIATGAYKDLTLNISGENGEGVIPGVVFLGRINSGQDVKIGERTAVIGGGNVAIDAARSALRIGSKRVSVLYRRSRQEMPANDEEIEEALSEGIEIEYLVAPITINRKSKKAIELRCIRMRLGEPDATGRRRPIPIEGSEFTVEADTLIPAVGQAPDLAFIFPETGVEVTARGTIQVDPITRQTSREGIFAGGDAVTGPGYAIEAIAAGKEAAISIHRYLNRVDLKEGREPSPWQKASVDDLLAAAQKRPREKAVHLPPEGRRDGFQEVKLSLTEEAALREAERCLNCGLCSECLQCVAVCKADAIIHDMKEEVFDIEVGSVILCPGFDGFDATRLVSYGYGRFPNVISSLQFERTLSASGPYQGSLLRPSDGTTPHRIAWIQCAGSRDMSGENGNEYCSSVCCMYAIKEAVIAKEHQGEVQPTIFYMDIRCQGKDFDLYFERAKQEYGVRFVRCMVSRVAERPRSKNLVISYIDENGRVAEEEFDLVVLSVGLTPAKAATELAQKLGIEFDPYGFCKTHEFSPLATSRQGIYVCGAFQGPKDIPETVAQASGAASSASSALASVKGTRVREKEYPPERDVLKEEPHIGVFVCHCGINIGGVVDVPQVREFAKGLDNVVYVEENLYTCSQDTQEKIKKAVEEYNLNRVVVASCSPRTHEPLFQETIREIGLNKYLFEMSNIRDQCSWVHMHQPVEATEKAKELVQMAVAKARLSQPLEEPVAEVIGKGLVIGGGLAGMTCALELAHQGFDCYLIEKGQDLGGNLRHIYETLEGNDAQQLLQQTVGEVVNHPRIRVLTDTEVTEFSGYMGNFKTKVRRSDRTEEELEHGAAIVATGAEELEPSEYRYGQDGRIITQRELEEKIARNRGFLSEAKTIAMIQCVGSRTDERPNCSRICCSVAVKNALKIKEINPEVDVYIFYRDIRTYGLTERYYTKARNAGITFIPYDPQDKPQVSFEASSINLSFTEPNTREQMVLNPDRLVLSAAIIPRGNEELAKLLKVPLTEDGFFLEAHMKLRPVDFATDGIFVAGMAHFPKSMTESISQAKAAAGRAATLLSKGYVRVLPIISSVDETKCVGCGLCESLCAYGAIRVRETDQGDKAETVAASCKGCGVCSASCPQRAVTMRHFSDGELIAQIEALMPVHRKVSGGS
ncbi:MAG: FAD-dependent oxidoreductase [Proteobacteria bacterium]|nr:FAD-dependent oxidoreductase [Pseudomonadota bacterium]